MQIGKLLFGKKREILQKLEAEEAKILIKLSSTDPDDQAYKEISKNLEEIRKTIKTVKYGIFADINWSDVVTTLIKVGAFGAAVFILLLIENSEYFPRSRNALNLIMNIVKKVV